MTGLNKCMLIGFLGDDPKANQVGETSVTKFSIATTESWKDKNGDKQEKTEWHNIEAWGGLGNVCFEYLHKGKQIYIEGRLQTDKYEKEGVTRYATKIVASNMIMLGGKNQGNDMPSSTTDDDDVPF